MKKLIFITSIFPSYRKFLLEELSKQFKITIVAGKSKQNSGFLTPHFINPNINFVEVISSKYLNNKFTYQKNLINIVKKNNPDFILISASLRDIGYWLLLFYCYINKIKLLSHGQGPFNKERNSITKSMYSLVNKLSYYHIVYTDFSLNKIKEFNISTSKTRVIENTIFNAFPVKPESKNYNKNEILFIGRLRQGSNLEDLFEVLHTIGEKHNDIICHVIGGGELEEYYKIKFKDFTNIKWYGKIYEDDKISAISKNCSFACYPGNTGLSVVHYLSLSLPVVIHDKIKFHQGPEASYIENNYNGLLFNHQNNSSLKNVVLKLIENKNLCKKLGYNAFNSYQKLSKPSYADKFLQFLK